LSLRRILTIAQRFEPDTERRLGELAQVRLDLAQRFLRNRWIVGDFELRPEVRQQTRPPAPG